MTANQLEVHWPFKALVTVNDAHHGDDLIWAYLTDWHVSDQKFKGVDYKLLAWEILLKMPEPISECLDTVVIRTP